MRTGAFTAVLALHVILILVLSYTPRHRLGAAASGPKGTGIGVFFDPGTAGTTGIKPEVERKVTLVSAKPASPAPKPEASQTPGSGGQAAGGSTGAGGGDGSAGPVRIGSGSGIVAISKVQPIYPPLMERARMEGSVVLDAVIHRDGSVGEIKVLKSSGAAFEEAAIKAVSQWRYNPLPYEGILTVTVNFNLSR